MVVKTIHQPAPPMRFEAIPLNRGDCLATSFLPSCPRCEAVHQFRMGLDAESGIDVLHVIGHRVNRQAEFVGDDFAAMALQQEVENQSPLAGKRRRADSEVLGPAAGMKPGNFRQENVGDLALAFIEQRPVRLAVERDGADATLVERFGGKNQRRDIRRFPKGEGIGGREQVFLVDLLPQPGDQLVPCHYVAGEWCRESFHVRMLEGLQIQAETLIGEPLVVEGSVNWWPVRVEIAERPGPAVRADDFLQPVHQVALGRQVVGTQGSDIRHETDHRTGIIFKNQVGHSSICEMKGGPSKGIELRQVVFSASPPDQVTCQGVDSVILRRINERITSTGAAWRFFAWSLGRTQEPHWVRGLVKANAACLAPAMAFMTGLERWRKLAAVGLAMGAACRVTWAQEQGPMAIKPLVVREDRLLLPSADLSSVTVFQAEVLRELNITTARQAMERVANVFVTQADSARASSFSVRGSHEVTFHEVTGGRAGVGFYLDDIPCSDAYGRDLTLFAVDGLSFYKGPHGSAFGVPHSMGVLDVVTRAPGPLAVGEASYIYGSHESHQALANVSGPILPNLFFGVDGLFAKDDGWFEDRLTGSEYGKHETASGRARLRWVPTDSLEVTLTAGLSHHDDDPSVYVSPDRVGDFYRVYSSPDAFAEGGQNYQALTALWKADGWQVKSITSHRESEFDDNDPVFLQEIFGVPAFPRTRMQDVSAWTQEIRVESSDPEADWRWRTGLFLGWWDSQLDHEMLGLGPWEGANRFRYRQDDYALHGELTRRVGDNLELSGGLRLQTTRNHTVSEYEPTPLAASLGGAPLSLDQRGNTNGILPMVAAGWKWAEEHHSYFRFSTGLQPGGEAIAASGSEAYDAERSCHYELGHDSRFNDDSVQIHAAVFRTEYYDYQSFQFNPAGQTVFNAERAHAWGVEAEARVHPCDGLELFAGAGWTRTRFDQFDSPAGDFSGKDFDNIPSASVNLGCAYHAPWGGMARLDWRYLGDTWFDVGNTVRQEAYALLDAKIGYERGDFGVYMFARNLLDEEYHTHTYLFQGAPAATPGVPRMLGIEVRARF